MSSTSPNRASCTAADDIAAIERLTERVLHPGSTVRKQVEHDERGRITQVIEVHEPFTVASQAREFSELVERLNRTPLTQALGIRYAKAYADFADALALVVSDESRDEVLAAGAEMRERAIALARAPGGHPDE